MSEYFRKPIVKTLMLKGQEGQSIKGIEKTGTDVLVDTYTITLTDGTTSTFTVTNGKGISSLEKTGTSGLVDTYTITFNDGTNSTFTVTNGKEISGIEKTGTDVLVDTYTITFNDGTTSTFTVTNGKGISNISKTETSGLVDTYTIEFNDGTTSTFTVTNGDSAYKPAVEALGKRIDNLILSSGTESSAEVVDARNGYDGTTYDTLGTAIRTQVSGLKGDLNELDKKTNTLNSVNIIDINNVLTDTGILYAPGNAIAGIGDTYKELNTAVYKPIIPIKSGDKIIIRDEATKTAFFGVALYDTNKIQRKLINNTSEITAEQDGFFRVCIWNYTNVDDVARRKLYVNINKDYGYTPYGLSYLSQKIVQETTDRTNADNALQEKINTNKNDISELDKKVNTLRGKKVIFFGDSITIGDDRTTYYVPFLIKKTGMIKVKNYAVAGATYHHKVSSEPDGNTDSENSVCNQVQKMINENKAGTLTDIPDIIVMSAGTNDSHEDIKTTTLRSQFLSDEVEDYLPLEKVNKNTLVGAMRWCAEKIWEVFPDTQIFVATPIQGAESLKYIEIQEEKVKCIKSVAERLSCCVIDAYSKSGIYGRYETANENGKYLMDGLHPNSRGSELMANCYASEITYQYRERVLD